MSFLLREYGFLLLINTLMTQLYVLEKPTKQHLKQNEEQFRQAKSIEEM